MPAAVVIERLRKSFGKTVAVNEVELTIQEGELFGLIGPDGAGKTTMIRMLCGLLEPDAGTASILGLDSKKNVAQIRKLLGYMPQRFSLYQDLTVRENLTFFADIFSIKRKERKERMERLLRFSRLGPFAGRRAIALSGGMKQKLALSCTLIHEPRVLFLDEPTTGVDPLSRREFWSILGELKANGVTQLVSTPYMDEASRCDRIAFMHKGNILAVETPDRIPKLFPDHVIEVNGTRLTERKPLFHSLQHCNSLKAFGDKLHLTTQEPELLVAELERFFEEQHFDDLSAHEVTPGIEDTFIALMGEAS